uniref:Activating signal cointegrator 1 complex subunit 3 n=1 Tax=Timema californicum TaxID=61474 RepID=A0A7R9J4F7_TIMCA|nr:unnamed protein product [Timema californicum]
MQIRLKSHEVCYCTPYTPLSPKASLSFNMAEDQSYLFPLQGSISEFSFKIPLGATKKNLLPIFDDILEDPKEDVVKVYLRIRPVDSIKRPSIIGWDAHQLTMEAPDDSATYKNEQHHKKYQHKFVFTKIFAPDADQRNIFEECVLEPIKNFIRGEDGLLFTYGTTNAGKTYTIQGTVTKPGIIPRALHLLFASIKGRVNTENNFKLTNGSSLMVLDNSSARVELEYKQTILNKSFDTESIDTQSSLTETSSRSSEMEEFISCTFREMQHHLHKEQDSTFINRDKCDMNFSVFVSFAEIYNENLYDLLEPPMDVLRRHRDGPKKRSLQFGRDLKGNTYIKGLRQIKVSSGDEAFQVLLFGQNNLQFASTELNSVSSRSHCIFSIILVRHADTEDPVITTINTFSFCDLAGTERAKKTHNIGERLKESQNINTSLLVLGRCLKAIRHNQKTKDKCMVPFRDSKLTQLFRQPLLSKNSSVAMIVNINPDPHIFDETITVLKFSAVAMEQLMNLVEHYKAKAHEERQRNHTLEQDLRNEMADQASAMVAQVQQEWEDRHLRLGQAQEELAQWRLERLEECYEKKLKKYRLAQTKSHDTEQMSELQTQLDDLKVRCSEMEEENRLLKELRNQSSQETQDLEVVVSRLKFQLSASSQDLTNAKKLLVAQMNDDSSSVAVELKLQLEMERKTNLEHSTKIKELNETLESAKEDFQILTNERNELEEQLEISEKYAALKSEELKDLSAQLRSCRSKLLEQSQHLDGKDETIFKLNSHCHEELNETLESAKEDFQILTNERNELEEQLEISEKYAALKSEELKDLSAQLRSCRSKLLEQSQHLDGKDETIFKLNSHCHELEEEIKALKQTLVTNQEWLSESRRNLEKSENKCQDFEITIKEQKSSLEEWESKCQNYEITIKEQKTSLLEWESKYQDIEATNLHLLKRVEELERSLQDLKSVVKEYDVESLYSHKDKVLELERSLTELECRLKETSASYQDSQETIEILKKTLNESESSLLQATSIHKENVSALEISLAECKSQLKDMKDSYEDSLGKVKRFEKELVESESLIQSLSQQVLLYSEEKALKEAALAERDAKLKDLETSEQVYMAKVKDLEMSEEVYMAKVKDLEMSEEVYMAKVKDLETSEQVYMAKVKDLETSEQAYMAKVKDLETSEQVYMAKVKDLEKTLEDLNSRLETVKLVHDKREEEINTLQKEVKNLLQCNLSMKEELDGKIAEVARLEQEIKTHQASKLCDDRKQLYSNYEVQVENLKVQLQAYKEEGVLAEVFRSEVNKKTQEIERLKEENEQMHQEIDFHTKEMDQLKSRRDQQFKAYEDLLKNAREETEREKKELSHFQEILYKTTPNSLRKESHAELEQLRREIDDKDRELSYYKEKVAKQEERVKKYQKEVNVVIIIIIFRLFHPCGSSGTSSSIPLMSRSETFKQPLERSASTTRIPTPASSRRPLRTQLDENSSSRRSSRQRKKCVKQILPPPMAVSSDFEEESEEKEKKKSSRRKLYNHTDEEVHLTGINVQVVYNALGTSDILNEGVCANLKDPLEEPRATLNGKAARNGSTASGEVDPRIDVDRWSLLNAIVGDVSKWDGNMYVSDMKNRRWNRRGNEENYGQMDGADNESDATGNRDSTSDVDEMIHNCASDVVFYYRARLHIGGGWGGRRDCQVEKEHCCSRSSGSGVMLMMESERLPRLTRSIRAFSDLARPSSKTLATSVDHANKLRAKQMKDGLSWSDLRKYVEQDAGSKSPAVKELSQLRSLAQELSGDQSKDVVDEVAAFLLSLFIDERLVTKKSSLILKQMFGAVSFNMATKVCECVSRIASNLTEDCIEFLRNGKNLYHQSPGPSFGSDLLRDLPEPRVPYYDTSLLHDLSTPVGVQAVRDFSMDYDSLAAMLPPKEEPVKTSFKKNGHGRSWLEKEVKKYYEVKNPSGLSIEEFLETVVTMLRSGRTNDELQNELFDLLGFDRFELIQMLLQHRTDIVYSAAIAEEKKLIISKAGEHQHSTSTLPVSKRQQDTGVEVAPYQLETISHVPARARLQQLWTIYQGNCAEGLGYVSNTWYIRRDSLSGETHDPNIKTTSFFFRCWSRAPDLRRPNYGCQVVVQSEQEKQLIKQARKEEKKISKVMTKDDDEEQQPEFNPVDLRAKRQAALKVAMVAPIFAKKPTARLKEKEVYPHVYDSQRQAQQMSGFISGTKMMLPENVERRDTKQYEEVNIPVSEQAPVNVGNKLVSISSLDEIGQMAFHGVKSLNRIQSVVFDTAYHTNENLLICAPTGAGKTNVALLTIVHQIRQFIDQGVIKKDQFKIVYVAPMKALAAEMTQNFSKKLGCLGITVRELTGDVQLTKTEILQTQMLVTTPEKWDLLIIDEVHLLHGDRGPVVEALVARTLRLVSTPYSIIKWNPLRSMIRIVGLSATLPNYLDVARFLRVNPYIGLFFFDSRFRPVPLSSTFVGVKAVKPLQQMGDMDQVCYEKVVEQVQKGHQVMVFVHARNATMRTATILKEIALQKNQLNLFEPDESSAMGQARKSMAKSRNKQLGDLFPYGFSVHHAGMLRCDRSLVEKYFSEGLIKVLVCTSTLAWGVNLPAHAVIIRGTEIYDAKHGSFVDLGILDVLQIFGRAGRPQFDKSGHGVIITSHDKLSHYLSLLTNQFPIESNFIKFLVDNLNAETHSFTGNLESPGINLRNSGSIARNSDHWTKETFIVTLGTISNLDEAVEWLSYTYLFVRMRLNPQVYGINYQDVLDDPTLEVKRRELIDCAARALDKARMIRYDVRTGNLSVTDLGRTASHFYIKYDTVEVFNDLMTEVMNEAEVLSMMSQATEFEQLKVRDDELDELDSLQHTNCEMYVSGGSENLHGKVNILLQTFLSRGRVNSFSLMSDLAYVNQNAVRITRALFDIALRKNNPIMAGRFLKISKMFEQQQWDIESPMRQFRILGPEIIQKIEERKLTVDKLREMDEKEIGNFLRHAKMGQTVKRCAEEFPMVEMEASLQPITRTVLRIRLTVSANFRWNDKVHGKTSENFYIWIEDPENNYMYHSEFFLLTKKQVMTREPQELVMTIPLGESLPPQYYVRAISDRWLGAETTHPLTFQHLILPESHPPHTDYLDTIDSDSDFVYESDSDITSDDDNVPDLRNPAVHNMCDSDENDMDDEDYREIVTRAISSSPLYMILQNIKLLFYCPTSQDLLELQPLPVSALGDPKLEALFPFSHFNPIQTQIFFCLYHTDNNVLLGAPTGSGKTIAAEIAMFRVFREYPGRKVVYIAPMKALVRERIEDWKVKLGQKLNRRVVELTGDVSPDIRAIARADVIVTTPEKWDGISRSWQTRNYVQDVALIVIDEIHLLGEDRGPVLEVIVSRTNFIASHTSRSLRIVGLSTALANAKDLANWLGIGKMGLYNFRPSVRPVPLEVHVQGFPGKHYCPRMATMNRPTFQAIRQHSPCQPTLVFVSSRRQTRLTALDLIAYLAGEEDPKQWLHMEEQEMEQIVANIKDSNLKLTLAFGIGMHHAGLQERDRKTVEELFVNQKIQILIATATLAWGVNFPAHLVVVKGTEYYDGKIHRYVDMPITDVLQMMGRAGRPQYDDSGIAMVLVHDVKKNFYKKFLYEPFPVESSLLEVLADHVNAEIVAGTVQTKQDILNYLTWTYFFRRLLQNPTYYNLESLQEHEIHGFLSALVDKALNSLLDAYCVFIDEDERSVRPSSMGRIASFYYLSHLTMEHFQEHLGPDLSQEDLLRALSDVHEYDQLPVRHNEDVMNGELAKSCPLSVDPYTLDSSHTKALLLLQAHFSRLPLPITDYLTDLKSVLDQSMRIMQAMIDTCAERGWLATTLRVQQIMQMVVQARWSGDSPLLTLPHLEPHHLYLFSNKPKDPKHRGKNIRTLPGLRATCHNNYEALAAILRREMDDNQIEQIHKVLCAMPLVKVEMGVQGFWSDGDMSQERRVTQPQGRDAWLPLHADQEYTLAVHLHRVGRSDAKAHCPNFPRGKDEGWFLVLGIPETAELVAMKRVSALRGSRSTQQLSFVTPRKTGRMIFTLYLISDCYLGWDQQYDIQCDITIMNSVDNETIDADMSECPGLPPLDKWAHFVPIVTNVAETWTLNLRETRKGEAMTWTLNLRETRKGEGHDMDIECKRDQERGGHENEECEEQVSCHEEKQD